MPIIHVHLKKGTSLKHRESIKTAIHDAMKAVLGVPDDDYNQITYEHEPENMIYDPNYFGVPRSEKMVFIGLVFNARPAQQKQALFEKIAANVVEYAGLRIEDVMMNIQETDPANWWAYARTVDPKTGTDSRMSAPPAS